MKFRRVIYGMLLMALFSCAKEKGRAVSSPTDGPVPILFQTAVGIEQEEREDPKSTISAWSGQELMIFGIYRRDGVLDLSPTGRYIDGVFSQAPSGGSGGFLPPLPNEQTAESYFYPTTGTLDFFACCLAGVPYPDDLFDTYTVSGRVLHRISEKYVNQQDRTLAFPIQVDGTQDVLAAYADRVADCSRSPIISPDQAYSGSAARENVYPTLRFFHVLSRLSLKAKAMGPGVRIKDIYIRARNAAELVVVRPNPASSPSVEIHPEDVPADLIVETAAPYDSSPLPTDRLRDLGECLIVPGDSRCIVYFTLKQDGKEGESDSHVTVDMGQYGLTFQSGMWYDINLSIYGPQKVEMTVTMSPWGTGYGEFDINPYI